MRRVAATVAALMMLALLTAGCGLVPHVAEKAMADDAGFAPGSRAAEPAVWQYMAVEEPSAPATGGMERKIILTASLSLEVTDIPEALADVTALARTFGGFVSESSVYGQERGQRRGYITLRVPTENLDHVLEAARELGKVIRDDSSTRDVTEEYIDLDARITNLQHQEQRLRDLLERADSVEEVLLVERELTRIRAELDSLLGRLTYLSRQVEMSTLHLDMVEVEEKPIIASGGWNDLRQRSVDSLVRGVNRVLDRTADAIVWLFGALPVLVLVGLALLVLVVVLRRRSWTPPRIWPPFRRHGSSG